MNNPQPPLLKVLMTVIDRNETGNLQDFLREKRIRFHYMINGMGTARSEILSSFGLSGSEKTVCICIVCVDTAPAMVASIADRFSLGRPGNGIICMIPVSGISAAILESIHSEKRERNDNMANTQKELPDEPAYSLVAAVLTQGYSEVLMEAARQAGVRGGTVINARHSGIEESVKFFGVTLQAEKEIVAIVVPNEQKAGLMRAINQKCGLHTEAHGVILSLPVELCAGIDTGTEKD